MRLPVLFLLFTVLLDAMGIGLILPVMPDLIREVQGGTLANAALWGGVLSTVFAVMQFLCGPLIGSLSDRFGRRPVLLVSLVVMAVDYLVMALAGAMWLLLLGRIVGGITSATHATANAYMADISAKEDRAANFGLLGAALGVGFVLGPLIGGVLGAYGTRAPFYAAAALAALNAIFGYIVLKETVTDAIRRPFSLSRANPLGALRQVSRLPYVRLMLAVYFLYSVAHYAYPAVWAYFTQARFDWSPQMIGLSLALYGIATAAVQAGLIRPMLRHLGESRTVIWGMLFDFISFGLIAVVTNSTAVLILTPAAALGGVVVPAMQGLMSQRVGADAQGELQGVLASAYALAAVVSPLIMTASFAAFSRPEAPIQFAGAPFVLSMILVALCILGFRRITSVVA